MNSLGFKSNLQLDFFKIYTLYFIGYEYVLQDTRAEIWWNKYAFWPIDQTGT